MRPSQAHFVTSCQQLLALGAVLAVLTPAASVISLDVVGQAPTPESQGGIRAGSGHAVELTAYTRESRRESLVPTAPVDAEVTDYALTPQPGVRGRVALQARTVAGAEPGSTAVVSRPLAAEGYAGVGVTWDPAAGDRRQPLLRGPLPHRRVLVRVDRHRLRRRPRARPRQPRGPPRATGHRRDVRRGRRRRPGAGRDRQPVPAGRDAPLRDRTRRPRRQRARGTGARHRRAAQRPGAGPGGRHVVDERLARDVHTEAEDLLPAAVGRQRVVA